jgi:Radical SAM superfamily/B12 binding domain
MPKVFLTNPPLNMAETPLQYHRPLVPLGLAYLGAMIEEKYSGGAWSRYVNGRINGPTAKGYQKSQVIAAQDNMFLSFYGQYSYEHLKDRIKQHLGDSLEDELYIGVSILSDGMHAARHILHRLRTEFPFATIIVGGPHPTFFPHDFYANPEKREGPLVDYVVRNEGELAILGIIDGLLATAESLSRNGPGLGIDPDKCDFTGGYRIIDGGQYGGRGRTFERHVLDSLPPPAYFLFEDEAARLLYEPDRRYGLEAPAANINSSRGCPHKCTFCTIPMLVPGYRTLSPSRILELVRFLSVEYGVRSIFFREDNFMYEGGTVDGTRWHDIEELCTGLKELRPVMRWAIEARADNLVQPALSGNSRLDVLAAAGLSGIYIGVESGADVMLKLYVKGETVNTMSDAIRACHARGIAVVATACYGDPDIFLRRNYPLIDLKNGHYQISLREQRESILRDTRSFMDKHEIPAERREEYALVGIPLSAIYKVLSKDGPAVPGLVEHYDPVTRYIYPKGFHWWAEHVYELKRRVRPLIAFDFQSIG